LPVAVTLNVAVCPTITVTLTGAVTFGADSCVVEDAGGLPP
jgi:hypothetical protein